MHFDMAALVASITGVLGIAVGWWGKYALAWIRFRNQGEQRAEDARLLAIDVQTKREAVLWVEIGKLQQEVAELRKQMDVLTQRHDAEVERIIADHKAEIAHVRQQKHDAQNTANGYHIENVLLKARINELLKELGQPPEFPMSELMHERVQ